jgi:hypothetical protein
LIVGTRGRDGAIGGLLPGSMSKLSLPSQFSYNRYCLQHSPVPVIVVHPYQRRLHRKHKREKDPDRQSYIRLLKLANVYSSSSDDLLPSPNRRDTPITEVTIDTPDTLSPDETELIQTTSEPKIHFDEADLTVGDRPALRHSITAPGRVDSPATDVETALEKQKNISPTDKG